MIGKLLVGTHVHCITHRHITTLCNKRIDYEVKPAAVKSSLLYLQCDVGVGEVASAGAPLAVCGIWKVQKQSALQDRVRTFDAGQYLQKNI